LLLSLASAQSTSTSYRLTRSSANAGGSEASSTSYVLNASAAQAATIGASSSPAFVLQSGFWSWAGSGVVPILLTVDRNASTAGNIDLSWSGNNAPYDIYQATDCTDVFNSLFDTTSANNYDNIAPPAASLVCYSILATAPGPAPPPRSAVP